MPVARDAQPRSQPEREPAGRPCQCGALAERARRSDGPARGQRELLWPELDSRRRADRAPGAARSRPAPGQAAARRLSAARERAGRAARSVEEAQLKALGQLAPGSAPDHPESSMSRVMNPQNLVFEPLPRGRRQLRCARWVCRLSEMTG